MDATDLLRAIFEAHDADGNGVLSLSELAVVRALRWSGSNEFPQHNRHAHRTGVCRCWRAPELHGSARTPGRRRH